jgi:outer membrane protein TolC
MKDFTAEVVAELADAKAAVLSLQAELADAKAQLGNVLDEDVAAIRTAFSDLKAAYAPAVVLVSPPAPQPAPTPPTN